MLMMIKKKHSPMSVILYDCHFAACRMLPCQELPPQGTRVLQTSCRVKGTQSHYCCCIHQSTILPAGATGKRVESPPRGTSGDCAHPWYTLTTQYEDVVSGALPANLRKGALWERKAPREEELWLELRALLSHGPVVSTGCVPELASQ